VRITTRRVDVGGVARSDEILEPRVVAGLVGVVPGDEALAALAGVVDEVLELGVVDDRGRLLALGDLGDLRAGERGVEVQGVRADLRQRDRRVDEAAMVTAHDRDARALADAGLPQRVRKGVRAAVHLGERERPEVVDDRRSGDGVARGRRGAEAVQREHGLGDLAGARGRRDARADQRLRREQLLQDAIRDVHGAETYCLTAASDPPGRRRAR
jgi:hypothetical protein